MDATAKDSTAPVATDSRSTSCTDGSQDVQLERENSAWDTLGERFFHAASDGRYIDLSNDDNTGTTLSASRAQEEFAAKPAPIDPSTIVHQSQATASQSQQESLLRIRDWSHFGCTLQMLLTKFNKHEDRLFEQWIKNMVLKKSQSDTVSVKSTMGTCEGFKRLSVKTKTW